MHNLKKTEVFTLLELLLVISVIAILASLLLPALSKAKETSRAAACQGNLKQLACGAFQYSSDYNDYTLTYSDTDGVRTWTYTLGPYLGLGNTTTEIRARVESTNTAYTCRSHRWREGVYPQVSGYKGRGYGINYHFQSACVTDCFSDGGILPKASMVKRPSLLIYFIESDSPRILTVYQYRIYGGSLGYVLSDGGFYIEKYWHNGYPNQLYFDGHVGKAKWYSILGTSEGEKNAWALGDSIR